MLIDVATTSTGLSTVRASEDYFGALAGLDEWHLGISPSCPSVNSLTIDALFGTCLQRSWSFYRTIKQFAQLYVTQPSTQFHQLLGNVASLSSHKTREWADRMADVRGDEINEYLWPVNDVYKPRKAQALENRRHLCSLTIRLIFFCGGRLLL